MVFTGTYREMQTECKRRGLKASGSAAQLQKRLNAPFENKVQASASSKRSTSVDASTVNNVPSKKAKVDPVIEDEVDDKKEEEVDDKNEEEGHHDDDDDDDDDDEKHEEEGDDEDENEEAAEKQQDGKEEENEDEDEAVEEEADEKETTDLPAELIELRARMFVQQPFRVSKSAKFKAGRPQTTRDANKVPASEYSYAASVCCPDEHSIWSFTRTPTARDNVYKEDDDDDDHTNSNSDDEDDGPRNYLHVCFTGSSLDQKWIGDGLYAVLTAGELAHGNYARDEAWNQLSMKVYDVSGAGDESWTSNPEGDDVMPYEGPFECDEDGAVNYDWTLPVKTDDTDDDDGNDGVRRMRARIIGIDNHFNAIVSVTYSPGTSAQVHHLMFIDRNNKIICADLWDKYKPGPQQTRAAVRPTQEVIDDDDVDDADEDFGSCMGPPLESFLHGDLLIDGQLFVYFKNCKQARNEMQDEFERQAEAMEGHDDEGDNGDDEDGDSAKQKKNECQPPIVRDTEGYVFTTN